MHISSKTGLPVGPIEPALGGFKLENKTCGSCGTAHRFAPKNSAKSIGLLWWDCVCGSTLCYELEKIQNETKDFKKLDDK